MNGYFSRLIQQTGIALGTSKVSSGADFQDAIAPQIGSEFVPIQIEENQEIGKQEAQDDELKPTRKVENKNIVVSQSLTPKDAENGNLIALPQVEIESSFPILEEQKTIIQEHQVESLSAQVTSSQNAIVAAENSPNVPKYDKRAESDRPLEIRMNNVVIKQPRSPETSLSEHIQERDTSRESETAKHTLPDRQTNEISKEPNLPPTRQVNLQTVLEWVAETPEENPNYQFPIPNSQFPIPDAQFPIPNSQFPNYPVQTNPNFVLSIGTISLTVEAPQLEVKKPPLPPVKSQQEVKPVNQTSRLSRHYIR